MKFKKVSWYRYPIENLIFSLFYLVSLRKHYIIKATLSVFTDKKFFFGYKNKCSKYEDEKVAIWQQFLKSGKHRYTLL